MHSLSADTFNISSIHALGNVQTFASESCVWVDLSKESFSANSFCISSSLEWREAISFFEFSNSFNSSSFSNNFLCKSSICSLKVMSSSLSFSDSEDLEDKPDKLSEHPSRLQPTFLFWSLCFFVWIDWLAFLPFASACYRDCEH